MYTKRWTEKGQRKNITKTYSRPSSPRYNSNSKGKGRQHSVSFWYYLFFFLFCSLSRHEYCSFSCDSCLDNNGNQAQSLLAPQYTMSWNAEKIPFWLKKFFPKMLILGPPVKCQLLSYSIFFNEFPTYLWKC